MTPFFKFGIGMLARLVGIVADNFARWTFQQVSEGADAGMDLLTDLWDFGQSLLRMLASQLCGRPMRRYYDDNGYDEGWQYTR
jgi:hypothetical protein